MTPLDVYDGLSIVDFISCYMTLVVTLEGDATSINKSYTLPIKKKN